MSVKDRKKLLVCLKKQLNGVHYFQGWDDAVRHTVQNVAAEFGIGLNDLFEGTRYAK